jgi:NitT/TauT family transport system substrate-binding protein
MKMRNARTILVLLLVAALLPMRGGVASAQTALEEISYGSAAPSSAEWPFYIANDLGFFRQEGLHPSIVVTGSTVSTINQIATGDINFATAGTDSVVNAVARHLAIKIVAPSMVTPPYSLMVAPSIANWQQLKGKTIILATKQEITAIAFRMMAKANHLDWNNDFSIVLAGSTPARFAALQSGNVQGAMLGQPFNFTAEAQGMRTLDESYNYMKVWMFDGISVNPAWAAAHRATVVKFIRALRKATEYAYTHRDDAIRVLTTETHSERAIVEKAYDLDFGKWHAYARDAQLDPKKVQGVIDGVVAQGVLPAPIPLSDLIDTSYGHEALR